MAGDLAQRIAHWAAAHEPDEDAATRIRISILDFVAVALAGLSRTELRPFLQLAAHGEQTLWDGGLRTDVAGAALLHGIAGSLLQLHDVHADLGFHASPAVIPAAWSAWQVAGDARRSPSALVAAVSAGYEVAWRIARACAPGQAQAGSSATGTAGALGAAVAAARLLGQDPPGIARALGNATLMLAATPSMPMRAHAAISPLHGGLAARCGIEAALLAADLGAGPHALEGDTTGPGLLALLRGQASGLDPAAWRVEHVAALRWKLAPGCVGALPAVEAAREIRARHAGPFDAVEVRMPRRWFALIGRGPHGDELYDRLMSVRWLVARALVAAPSDPFAALDVDPATAELAARIEVGVSAELDALGAEVEAVDVAARSGSRRLSVQHRARSVRDAWATPAATQTRRADDPALRDKWRRLLLPLPRAAAWAELCAALGEPAPR